MKRRSEPGSFVESRAEMDTLAVVSNCRQADNPYNAGVPTAIRVLVLEPG